MHSMMRPASKYEDIYKSFKNEIAVVAAKGTLTFVLVTHCWSEIGSRCHLEYKAPHGVDGTLDGQLLELLHGMEWWLLLALLRLSMALRLEGDLTADFN